MSKLSKTLLSFPPLMLSLIIISVSTVYSQFFWTNRIPDGLIMSRAAFGLMVSVGFSGLYFALTVMPKKFGAATARAYVFSFILITGVYGAVETHDIGLRERTMATDSYQLRKELLEQGIADVKVRNKKKWGLYENTLPSLLNLQSSLDESVENMDGTTSGMVQYASMSLDIPPSVFHGSMSAASSVALDLGVSLSNGLLKYIWFGEAVAFESVILGWFRGLVTLVTSLVTLVIGLVTGSGRKQALGKLKAFGNGNKRAERYQKNDDSGNDAGNGSGNGNDLSGNDAEIIRLCRTMTHKGGKHDGKPKYRDIAKIAGCSHVHAMNVFKRWQGGTKVNAQNATGKAARMAQLENYLTINPDASKAEMAQEIGVSSIHTIDKYLNELGKSADHRQPGTPFERNSNDN